MQNIRSMSKAQRTSFLGLMTALVVVLQLLASVLAHFGLFSVSLVLVPIVIGAALAGPLVGAWLGFVFGLVTLFTDGLVYMGISVFGAVVICLGKGIAAGALAGLVFSLLQKKNRWLAILAAAVVCPVVNTGIFLAGTQLFFYDMFAEYAAGEGYSGSIFLFVVMFIAVNFLFELLFNLVLSPAIYRITGMGEKIFRKPKR